MAPPRSGPRFLRSPLRPTAGGACGAGAGWGWMTTEGCTGGWVTASGWATSGSTVSTAGGTGDGTGRVMFSTVPLSWSRRSRSGAQDARLPKVLREITKATRFKDTNHILG